MTKSIKDPFSVEKVILSVVIDFGECWLSFRCGHRSKLVATQEQTSDLLFALEYSNEYYFSLIENINQARRMPHCAI